MAVDLSTYKNAIANAYEGRAVRDAIVAMVQAVQDAINAGSSGLDSRATALETTVSGTDGLESQVSALETTVSGTGGINDKITDLYHNDDTIGHQIYSLDQRVTALEGGGNT